MKNIKQRVIELIKELPENITAEGIMDSIYVQQKILKGQKDLAAGKSFSQAEARKIASKA